MKDGENGEDLMEYLIPKFEMIFAYAVLLTFVIALVGSKS